MRPELSVGTELLRGRLDLDYQYRPDSTLTSLRLESSTLGRSYWGSTDYSLSSDALETRSSARLFLGPAGPARTDESCPAGARSG